MAEISLRPAKPTDFPRIVEIFTQAFWDEDAIGRFMHPHRNEFPEDLRQWWHRKLRAEWWDRQRFFVVSVVGGDTRGKVVGVANWSYLRAAVEGDTYSAWAPGNWMKKVVSAWNRVSVFFWPNRAADPTKVGVYERAMPFFAHHWAGSLPCFSLDGLGVHPDYQGQGHGRALVRWGLEKAETEGIPASVVSAAGKELFYRRCGFTTIVGKASEGVGNPLEDVQGGAILFKDVTSTNTRF